MKLIRQFVSLKCLILSALVILPFEARAEYYVVSEAPEVVCDSCAAHYYSPRRHHYRHHVAHRHYYHHYVTHKRRSSYTMTVYYPLPAYAWAPPPCGCCKTRTTVTRYYSAPYESYSVYYMKPGDRLVGNVDDGSDYYGADVDTTTEDNDIN